MSIQEMSSYERFKGFMNGTEIDRLPVIEWAPYWGETLKRWRTEGLPDSCVSNYDIQNYFGLDKCCQTILQQETAATPQPKFFGGPIITSEEEYEAILPTLYPEPRFSKEHIEWLKKTRRDGDTIHFFTTEGFFWMPRVLMGIEPHLFSFYDQPELYHRINHDNVEWLKKVLDYVLNVFDFDFMTFEEDMSYNNGPMLSKTHFDEFILPYYKEILPLVKGKLPVIIDSDGDITAPVDWYREAGADGMLPLEKQAGVDVALYIKKQPDMAFIGHFNKMCMKNGEAAMTEEFERLLPSARNGKVLISCDHQTPPDVSIDNYRIYVRLLKKYAKLAVEK